MKNKMSPVYSALVITLIFLASCTPEELNEIKEGDKLLIPSGGFDAVQIVRGLKDSCRIMGDQPAEIVDADAYFQEVVGSGEWKTTNLYGIEVKNPGSCSIEKGRIFIERKKAKSLKRFEGNPTPTPEGTLPSFFVPIETPTPKPESFNYRGRGSKPARLGSYYGGRLRRS